MLKITRYRPQSLLFLVVSYTLWAAVTLRWITEYIEANHPLTWLVSGILVLFGILIGLEPWITGKSEWRAHAYLALQTTLVMVAILFYYQLDFFAILFLPLCGQAMFLFPRRTAAVWVLIFVLATITGQIHQFGWPEGLSFIFLYTAGLIFVSAFSSLTLRAEDSRLRTEELLLELQQAHRQLQEYAGQAEELAIAKERNRLARDLHDSVAQTLYGLTLQSETALRHLAANHLNIVADYLKEIRHSAQETLQETRLLIFELRPPVLEQEGLAAALRARLESVESRAGLKTEMVLEDGNKLPVDKEAALYRIAQEALNNILKHASASRVSVSLLQDQGKIALKIRDDGVGFDPSEIDSRGGLGLQNMRERAHQIGGRFDLTSSPNSGTRIKVEVPL